jgi:uncharacterized protein with LGFP repeats
MTLTTSPDPTQIDPVADPEAARTFSERVVARAASLLAPAQSRRSFLVKSAVVGSAIVVNPLTYILKPGTAYAALCGTCSDGWTAFCCTINGGNNSCPPGSFVAGWWKADNAAYCCGAARYIIDCNASCPTQCGCRCSGDGCDGRRTCCNQFRYGQCHQEISCYGPVVCRVATCTPPWIYDGSCSTSSATDNRTVTHGSNCLTTDCGPTLIDVLYAQTGGAGGFLGPRLGKEAPTADRRGRYAMFAHGGIWHLPAIGPREVHGAIFDHYRALRYTDGPLGYPTSNGTAVRDGSFNRFEQGTIWWAPALGAHHTQGPIDDVYRAFGGPDGVHGWPVTNHGPTPNGLGAFTRFERGAVYVSIGSPASEVHGAIHDRYRALGESDGRLGYPVTHEATFPGTSTRYSRFERGSIWSSTSHGVRALIGGISAKYLQIDGPTSPLGLPVADEVDAGGGGRSSRFVHGAIYYLAPYGPGAVYGPIYDRYVVEGQSRGRLGYPIRSIYTDGPDLLRCDFQRGRITLRVSTGVVTVS